MNSTAQKMSVNKSLYLKFFPLNKQNNEKQLFTFDYRNSKIYCIRFNPSDKILDMKVTTEKIENIFISTWSFRQKKYFLSDSRMQEKSQKIVSFNNKISKLFKNNLKYFIV